MKKIKNIILDCAIWIVNTIGTPFMKILDMLVEREDEVKAKKAAPKHRILSPAPTYFTTTTAPPPKFVISSSGNPGIGISTTTNPTVTFSSNFQPQPFSIGFSWQGKTRTITLENGEDIHKLVDVAAMLMKLNNIPFKITEP